MKKEKNNNDGAYEVTPKGLLWLKGDTEYKLYDAICVHLLRSEYNALILERGELIFAKVKFTEDVKDDKTV
jgi:hypothetical protein